MRAALQTLRVRYSRLRAALAGTLSGILEPLFVSLSLQTLLLRSNRTQVSSPPLTMVWLNLHGETLHVTLHSKLGPKIGGQQTYWRKNQSGHRWPEEAEASSLAKFLAKLFLEAVSSTALSATPTSTHHDLKLTTSCLSEACEVLHKLSGGRLLAAPCADLLVSGPTRLHDSSSALRGPACTHATDDATDATDATDVTDATDATFMHGSSAFAARRPALRTRVSAVHMGEHDRTHHRRPLPAL